MTKKSNDTFSSPGFRHKTNKYPLASATASVDTDLTLGCKFTNHTQNFAKNQSFTLSHESTQTYNALKSPVSL